MHDTEFIAVFTAKSIETIFKEGGSKAWRLDRNHARKCAYAVLTRNSYAEWVQGTEPHHSAFLVGKIKDVVPAKADDDGDRWMILFSEYARVDIPDVWQGDRNPVRYFSDADLKKLGLDISALKWEPMPPVQIVAAPNEEPPRPSAVRGLTMLEAKKGLAATFGVSPDAIEITIRG